MPTYPMFLSELAEADRKHVKLCIRMLLQELKEVSVMVDEMKNELVERHRLPNDLKQIDDGLRRDFRNLLLGIPMK